MNLPDLNRRKFRSQLLDWYRIHARNLPWRANLNPYAVWIAEIMLQQTTVQTVIPYYKAWMKRFPDMKALNRAPLQKVLNAWQGLGYYQRAQNLHRAAAIIIRDHGGRIPRNPTLLRRLPGFGPYTTAAVLSQAFDLAHPAVDANVRRVGMRLLGMKSEASVSIDRGLIKWLEPLLPERGAGIFNQAMMELGALICRPKNPACLRCPLIDFCKAFRTGEQEIIPRPRYQSTKMIQAVIAVITHQSKHLIQKRPEKGLLAGLWEFPGGKVQAGESRKNALRREIKEELGLELKSFTYLTQVTHAYTQYRVTLHAFQCSLERRPSFPRESYRWVTLTGMRRFPMPSGSVKIVRFLENARGLDSKEAQPPPAPPD